MDGNFSKKFVFDLQRFDTTKEMKVITQDSDGSLKVQNATVTLNAQNVVTAVATSGTATALETTTVDGKSVYALDGDYVIDKSTVTLKNSLYVADGSTVGVYLFGKPGTSATNPAVPAIITSDSTDTAGFYNNSLIVVQQGGSLTVRSVSGAANANIDTTLSSAISVIGEETSGKTTTLTFDRNSWIFGKDYGIKDEAVSGTTINISNGAYIVGTDTRTGYVANTEGNGTGIYTTNGTLNISGGGVRGGDKGIELINGSLTVRGGMIDGYKTAGVEQTAGSLTVTGTGTVEGKTIGAKVNSGNLIVSNGNVKSTQTTGTALVIDGAGVDATISGGNIGICTQRLATITPNAIGLQITNNTSTTDNASKVAITGGSIYGQNYSLDNKDTDVAVDISGGTINSALNGPFTISGEPTLLVQPSDTSYYKLNINGTTQYYVSEESRAATLAKCVAVIGDNADVSENKYFTLVNYAVRDAANNDTIKLLKDTEHYR